MGEEKEEKKMSGRGGEERKVRGEERERSEREREI